MRPCWGVIDHPMYRGNINYFMAQTMRPSYTMWPHTVNSIVASQRRRRK